jgi:hypothetical protein
MTITVKHIAAQDQIPFPNNLDPIPISNVYGNPQTATNNNNASFIIDSDETSKWTSESRDDYVFIELPDLCTINRMDIEWDPHLSRTGKYIIDFIYDAATPLNNHPVVHSIVGQQNTSLFSLINNPAGFQCRYIKINLSGQSQTDYRNGITNVKLWGKK